MNARWRAPAGLHTASARLPVEGELPSFGGATGWLNSRPLTRITGIRPRRGPVTAGARRSRQHPGKGVPNLLRTTSLGLAED